MEPSFNTFSFESFSARSAMIKEIALDPKQFMDQLRFNMERNHLGSYDNYTITHLIEIYLACLTNTQDDVNNGSGEINVRIPEGFDKRDLKNPIDIDNFKDKIEIIEKHSGIILGGDNGSLEDKAAILSNIPEFIYIVTIYLIRMMIANINLDYINIIYQENNKPGRFLARSFRYNGEINVSFSVNTIKYDINLPVEGSSNAFEVVEDKEAEENSEVDVKDPEEESF